MSKILIVEDEVSVALELDELLSSHNYDIVGIAASASEACSMAQTDIPDLILMDIKIPGEMDGIDVAIKVKQQFGIRSLFSTGHGKSEFVERAKEADPLGYILKPLNEIQILAAVEIALDIIEKEKYLEELHEHDSLLIKRGQERLDKLEERLQNKRDVLKKISQGIQSLNFEKNGPEESPLKKNEASSIDLFQKARHSIPVELLCLSSQELRIASMIRGGESTHRIAETLNISIETVNWHRKNIRKKLGLKGKNMSLMVKLASLSK